MSITLGRAFGNARDTRLSVLVSNTEAERISRDAAAAGQSVSSFLRDRALAAMPAKAGHEAEALLQIDHMLGKMSHQVESAIAEVSATLQRLNWPPAA